MTIETCKKRLEICQNKGDTEGINFWKARMERKLKKPKYANLNKPVENSKDGKKSKR